MSGGGKRPVPVFRPKPHAIEAIFGRRETVASMAVIAAGRTGAYVSLPTIEALTIWDRHGAGTRDEPTVGTSS